MTTPDRVLGNPVDFGSTSLRVRVCKTCAVTVEKFRAALLRGSREDAMAAYDIGCVNLRTPYSFYDSEVGMVGKEPRSLGILDGCEKGISRCGMGHEGHRARAA